MAVVGIATPPGPVITVAGTPNVAVAPPAAVWAAKVTLTPCTPLPKASLTVACNWGEKNEFTLADPGVPCVAVMLTGAPALFVRLIFVLIVPLPPIGTVAVTIQPPAIVFARIGGAIAWPFTSVGIGLGNGPKVPLAPLPWTVKVTSAPCTGAPVGSRTVTCIGLANAV